jgi:hypothetical protein
MSGMVFVSPGVLGIMGVAFVSGSRSVTQQVPKPGHRAVISSITCVTAPTPQCYYVGTVSGARTRGRRQVWRDVWISRVFEGESRRSTGQA